MSLTDLQNVTSRNNAESLRVNFFSLAALTVVDVLQQNGFDTFLSLLERADLTDVISSTENVTILVPSSAALAAVPAEVTDDFAQLREVLSYHVIDARLEDKCDLEQGQQNTFVPNSPINFKTYISVSVYFYSFVFQL